MEKTINQKVETVAIPSRTPSSPPRNANSLGLRVPSLSLPISNCAIHETGGQAQRVDGGPPVTTKSQHLILILFSMLCIHVFIVSSPHGSVLVDFE